MASDALDGSVRTWSRTVDYPPRRRLGPADERLSLRATARDRLYFSDIFSVSEATNLRNLVEGKIKALGANGAMLRRKGLSAHCFWAEGLAPV